MRKAAQFGHQVVVHVEPDLWGYLQQRAGNGTPASVSASVNSSGNVDVATFANNVQGFGQALLHLRDLYAPNVLLAFHASDWAALWDVGSYTGRDLDAAALGRKVAAFANASGVRRLRSDTSAYDLVFNDVADRDSEVSGIWWDRRNVAFPNFHRWERYVGAIHAATGRPLVVWQVPEGNQWFRTEDGSPGHTQDNRAEYFLNHVGELNGVGIVALLFGRGNPSTTHTDADGDGETNPPAVCTTDGVSTGTVCNGHLSRVADDDGGYLRMRAREYYRSPVPLG
jgi:hypothetical protein